MEVRIGDIAKCSHGYVGLVTSIVSREGKPIKWEGRHLSYEKFNDRWESISPTLLIRRELFGRK